MYHKIVYTIILLDHKPRNYSIRNPDGISRGITNTNTTSTNNKLLYRYLHSQARDFFPGSSYGPEPEQARRFNLSRAVPE